MSNTEDIPVASSKTEGDEISLLCTGDIHLGRHPTRLPASDDGPLFSPKTVWRSTAETAIERNVDAVLISGDIVDRDNRYYEAFGAFEEGASLLDEADIPLYVVAGNHDFDTLPRLVDSLDLENLTLLGAGGAWERTTLSTESESTIHIDAWSFAREHVHSSPLDDYDLSTVDEPVLGLLHGDYEAPESEYAPIRRTEFDALPPDGWLLGHIHAPGVRSSEDPLVFYPGSPQPLDPGEPREHGPWLLTYSSSTGVSVDHVPLASVRYDSLSLEVTESETPQDIPGRVRELAFDHLDSIPTQHLELISFRVALTGRSEHHGAILQEQPQLEEQLQFKHESTDVRVEQLAIETQPAIDLEARAAEDTPVGYLAQLILDFQESEHPDEYRVLQNAASEAIQEAYASNAYSPLRKAGRITEPDTGLASEMLERRANALLDELVAQRDPDQ